MWDMKLKTKHNIQQSENNDISKQWAETPAFSQQLKHNCKSDIL